MKLALVVTAALVAASGAVGATSPMVAHTAGGTMVAQASLLRIGDFGSGWTSAAATGASTGLSFACSGFTPKQNDVTEIGTASSPSFKASVVGPIVVQRTSVYENAKQAEKLWRRAVKPKLVDCAVQSLQALGSRGVTVSITETSRLPVPPLGDGVAGYRVVATLTSKSRLKTFYDVIVIRGGRAITQLTISQFQKPVALKSETALARIAARRMGAGGNVA
jgi:hypothetical protein